MRDFQDKMMPFKDVNWKRVKNNEDYKVQEFSFNENKNQKLVLKYQSMQFFKQFEFVENICDQNYVSQSSEMDNEDHLE